MAACDDKFHEECGVFAIYDRNRPAALETYYGIFSLQHRGQESAGITCLLYTSDAADEL